MATKALRWLARTMPAEFRTLVREAIHGPVVDESQIVHRFLGSAGNGRVMIDVGALSPDAPDCFARAGWHVLAFDPDGDRSPQLSSFCRDQEKVESVGLLKVNVEGAELAVLREFPWDWIKPDVVICEFAEELVTSPEHRFSALADLLVAQGYQILVSEWYPTNSYDTSHRWRRFVPYPCQLVSTHAWGNLIAVRGPDELARLRSIAQV